MVKKKKGNSFEFYERIFTPGPKCKQIGFGAVQKLYHAPKGGGVSRGHGNEGIQLFFLWEKVSKWREIGGGISRGPK